MHNLLALNVYKDIALSKIYNYIHALMLSLTT